jgi:uncharacterized protein (DUF1330 family)
MIHMNRSRLVLIVCASISVGFVFGNVGREATAQPLAKPAYLIASSRPIHPEKMTPYRQAAGPLATKAGLEILASGDPALHVLEGAWPHSGGLTIERYRSMDELLAFWNSPAYQEAKKLREGNVEMHFIVALDGR